MANGQPEPLFGMDRRLVLAGAGVVVLAIVLAGAGWFWSGKTHHHRIEASRPKLIGVLGDTTTMLDASLPDSDRMCSTALKRAQAFGTVPDGATLTSGDAKPGQTDGRYTCEAQGGNGKYTLAIDTKCPANGQNNCFALDSVRREDGTVLYQHESGI